ncbi:MAG: choice-of-anchor Q domain-containing protein [Rhodanobacteraceae bacterium]
MFRLPATLRMPRRSALSISLAAVSGFALSAGTDALANGAHPTTMHTVTTCADDDSPGSLRAIIASPNTDDGDTIDLTQLACSTITLDESTHVPSHITVNQPSLHLLGPGSSALTIDGALHSSVLRHLGNGTLDLEGVSIANGKYVSANQPFGGCLYSRGNITLTNVRVEACATTGTGATDAMGGGVFAKHDLKLERSEITNSGVHGDGAGTRAYGGGAYVGGGLETRYSTISHNVATADLAGLGGGVAVFGDTISIASSTIHSNRADSVGGIYLPSGTATSEVTNSTISGNEAISYQGGGIYAYGNLKISSSTIAFNHDHGSGPYAGVTVGGASLTLESSILSGNSGPHGEADLHIDSATSMNGSNNLVVVATGVSMAPADCPKLDPLADNGGATATHAIPPVSPAIDAGSNSDNLVFDQTGNFRVVGAAADIGAVEWRSDLTIERLFAGGFDGVCDQ